MNETDRPMEIERLAPGTRVSFNSAKWTPRLVRVEYDPLWQSKEWASNWDGVAVDPSEYDGRFELPSWATPVRFRQLPRVTWFRTSCLDVLEPCDHDWELQDDSFDHEYGTEQIGYYRCALCDETKPYDSTDAHPDDF